MDKTRKISYKSLKEKMSDNQLKRIIAGSGDGVWGTCAAISPNGSCGANACEMSRSTAIWWATCEDQENGTYCHGGHWCFDTCGPGIDWYKFCCGD